jgi:hypothetical protein
MAGWLAGWLYGLRLFGRYRDAFCAKMLRCLELLLLLNTGLRRLRGAWEM